MTPWPMVPTRMVPGFVMLHLLGVRTVPFSRARDYTPIGQGARGSSGRDGLDSSESLGFIFKATTRGKGVVFVDMSRAIPFTPNDALAIGSRPGGGSPSSTASWWVCRSIRRFESPGAAADHRHPFLEF